MVCTVLYFQGGMTVNQVFTICTSFHAVAILVALLLEYELSKKAERACCQRRLWHGDGNKVSPPPFEAFGGERD